MPEMSLIRKRGRPTKLTIETRERLVAAIGLGSYYDDACAYAGISYTQFREWRNMGELASAGPHRDLYLALKKAEAEAVMRMTAQWQKAMTLPGNWQAIATFLERRYPDKWGRRTLEVTGKDGGPVQHQVMQITPRDIAEALKILHDMGVKLDDQSTSPVDGSNPAVLSPQAHA